MKKIFAIILALFVLTLALVSCGAKEITGITIDDGLVREYNVNDTPDFSNVKATVKYNDDTTKSITAADLTFSTIDTSTPGTKKLTITYDSFSITVDITVKQVTGGGDEYPYVITGAELPSSITNRENTYANLFTDKEKAYYVGDDNPYKLSLVITAVDENDQYVTNLSYVSASMVYLVESGNETLVGSEYVVIDENNNTFDFTEAAIGKTFKIVTRPSEGILDDMIEDVTATHTVCVVDGYNVTNAKELNLITNADDDVNDDGTNEQLAAVNEFLANNGITRPDAMKAVVLHNDFTVQPSDLPASYFCNYTDSQNNAKSEFYDYVNVYYRKLTAAEPTFSIYGNYYTIYSYNLPCVVAQGQGNQSDAFSNGQLFKFEADTALRTDSFDNTKYVANMYDLALRDDNPNTDDETASDRSMRGLIAIKTQMNTTNIENTNIDAFYISSFAESDWTTVNLNKVKFYNAWQGHVFLWTSNQPQSKNDEPWANHKPVVLNVTESSLTKCGGPVILSQNANIDYTCNKNSKAIVNIDAASTLESWVAGTEAWFTAMGVSPLATNIKAMSGLITASAAQQNKTAGYIKADGNETFINLIYVNMVAGTDALAGGNVDGKVTVNGADVINQNDGENTLAETYISATTALGAPPIFQSSAGGVCFGNPGSDALPAGAYGLDFTTGQPSAADSACFEGDYIALYYNGLGVLLEYMH